MRPMNASCGFVLYFSLHHRAASRQKYQSEFFGGLVYWAILEPYFTFTCCQQKCLHGGVVEFSNLPERSIRWWGPWRPAAGSSCSSACTTVANLLSCRYLLSWQTWACTTVPLLVKDVKVKTKMEHRFHRFQSISKNAERNRGLYEKCWAD